MTENIALLQVSKKKNAQQNVINRLKLRFSFPNYQRKK